VHLVVVACALPYGGLLLLHLDVELGSQFDLRDSFPDDVVEAEEAEHVEGLQLLVGEGDLHALPHVPVYKDLPESVRQAPHHFVRFADLKKSNGVLVKIYQLWETVQVVEELLFGGLCHC